MYIPSRERIRLRVEEYRKAHAPPAPLPPAERCLICRRPMPPWWARSSPQDDAVCPECDARQLRPHTGWAGYAGQCPDVSGGDSGWDNIVRMMEDQA